MKIKISNIYFSYNDNLILKDITFYVNKKEILCILGKNGAGKSTLLKCINQILKPDKGCIYINGKDISTFKQRDIAKFISYIPQKYPESKLTVFDTILLGRRPYFDFKPNIKDYKIVEDIIKEIQLENIAMRELTSLSGGELQKVIIAMAISRMPNILLLDEPISNLDLKNQIEILKFIKRIVVTKDICAILVIHDLNMALRFGDKFLFLKNGEIYCICNKEDINPNIIYDVYNIKVDIVKINNNLLIIPN